MQALQVCTLAGYNHWMNERLYEACAQLDDDQRKRDRKAFFSSIHGSLNHILLADRIWLGRFIGQPFAAQSLDQELYADFAALCEARAATDREIDQWAAQLNDADLQTELRYTSMVNPEPRCYPMWLAVTHFFNHQTHHRGQITALLSQCGIDYGVTDLIFMPAVNKPAS